MGRRRLEAEVGLGGRGGGCASFSFLPSMLCKQAGALCRDKLKARAGYR